MVQTACVCAGFVLKSVHMVLVPCVRQVNEACLTEKAAQPEGVLVLWLLWCGQCTTIPISTQYDIVVSHMCVYGAREGIPYMFAFFTGGGVVYTRHMHIAHIYRFLNICCAECTPLEMGRCMLCVLDSRG